MIQRAGQSFASIRGRRPVWLTAGLLIAVAVNALLITAYLWSRGGQTTHVTLEARESNFRVTLDGKQVVSATFPAPATGGIALFIEDTNLVPSLPTPRGIDRVVVTDLASGDVLLEDDFSSFPGDNGWQIADGEPELRDGVLGTTTSHMIIRILDVAWGDIRVDVTYRNMTTGIITVRMTNDSRVAYDFRPWRHLDGHLQYHGEESAPLVGHPNIEASRSGMIQSMLAMILEPLPWLLVIVPALTVVSFAAPFFTSPWQPPRLPQRLARERERLSPWAVWIGVASLAVVVFGVTLHLNYSFGAHMIHVPDETSYVFQAKVLATGHLWADPPAVADSFQLGNPPLIVEHDGKWSSLYPFGHPLALAFGAAFGAIWIIPPLLGAACVLLVFAVGRNVFGIRVGLFAALLFGLSPFVLMTASNFMSHNTAAFYLLCSLMFLTLRTPQSRRQIMYGALAGAFFTMIFATRQLTGAAFIPAFGFLLLTGLVDREQRVPRLRQLAGFIAGAGVILLAYFAYRWLLAGDPFAVDPAQGGDDTFGFSAGHSVAAGIANAQTLMSYLTLVLDNAPVATGLVLMLLPFMFGTRSRWDWFLLLASLSLMSAYVLYYYHGLMHGPRFWYESVPLLVLLAARGIDRGATLLAQFGAHLHGRYLGRKREASWAPAALAYGLVGALAFIGWHNWLIGDGRGWQSDFVPPTAAALRNFNGTDDRIVQALDDADIERGLLLIDECPQWWCYGSVVWRNSPSLDGDLVYARNLPERNSDLFALYPGRQVYTYDYFTRVLRVYGGTTNIVDTETASTAPFTDDIPRPTPVPTATPDVNAGRRRDEQRVSDLSTVAGLLAQYHDAHGAYPQSGGVQTLCTYPNDAGCKLGEFTAVPKDPDPDGTYWYLSERGETYTVFARMENEPPPSDCPEPVPVHLAEVERLYCVASP